MEAAVIPKTKAGHGQLVRLLYCLLISFAAITICSRSSFIYPFNDWVDANIFFTIGKGMNHGLVPYLDLTDHKGPLLFFIHMIGSAISQTSFTGVYILEVVSFAACLYFLTKTIDLFTDGNWYLILVPIFALVALTSFTFRQGDSAEEFCMPFLAASLYYLLKHMAVPEQASWKMFLGNGIAAGCVFWIKFTMSGFWIGWILCFFVVLLWRKSIKKAFAAVGFFLLGMLLSTLPWLVYFGIHDAIGVWIQDYLTVNITGYGGSGHSLAAIVKNLADSFVLHLRLNKLLFVLAFGGVVYFAASGRVLPQLRSRISLLLCAAIMFFFVFFSGQPYLYYFLIFAPFAMLGLIGLARLFQFIAKGFSPPLLMGAVVAVCCILAAYKVSPNIYFSRVAKDDLAQYRFAEIMHEESDDPTLLNYGFLDGGFYTAADILPVNKYFSALNLAGEYGKEIREDQDDVVKEKRVEYLVLRPNSIYEETLEDVVTQDILDNYELIAEHTQEFESWYPTYYLFRVKE